MIKSITKLPVRIKERWVNLIGTALGLFLALRFNDFFRTLLDKVLPDVNGVVGELIVLILLSVVIVSMLIIVEDLFK